MPIDRDNDDLGQFDPDTDSDTSTDYVLNTWDDWEKEENHQIPDEEIYGNVDGLPDQEVDKLWRNDW